MAMCPHYYIHCSARLAGHALAVDLSAQLVVADTLLPFASAWVAPKWRAGVLSFGSPVANADAVPSRG